MDPVPRPPFLERIFGIAERAYRGDMPESLAPLVDALSCALRPILDPRKDDLSREGIPQEMWLWWRGEKLQVAAQRGYLRMLACLIADDLIRRGDA